MFTSQSAGVGYSVKVSSCNDLPDGPAPRASAFDPGTTHAVGAERQESNKTREEARADGRQRANEQQAAPVRDPEWPLRTEERGQQSESGVKATGLGEPGQEGSFSPCQ